MKLKKIYSTLLDFIFPSFCVGCQKKDRTLCDECLSKIPLDRNQNMEDIFPVFDYQNKIIKEAIWALKFKNNKIIAQKLARSIYDKLLEEINELETFYNFQEPIIIAIPLSQQRLKERGFNQSELIIEKLSLIDPSFISFDNVLYKIKDTKSQSSIKDKKKRLENVQNCFTVKNKEKIKNRNIILIDDVTTTGATLNEAKKILIKSGAKKVIAFTVAH